MYQVQIGKKIYHAKVCKTTEEQADGMQNKLFTDFNAMYFDFPYIGQRSFHTQNCLVPLDIIFIIKNQIIGVHPNCAPNSPLLFKGIADAVLELPGTTVFKDIITIGKKVKIDKDGGRGQILQSPSSGKVPLRKSLENKKIKNNKRKSIRDPRQARKRQNSRNKRKVRN